MHTVLSGHRLEGGQFLEGGFTKSFITSHGVGGAGWLTIGINVGGFNRDPLAIETPFSPGPCGALLASETKAVRVLAADAPFLGDPLRPLHDAIAAAAKALNDQRERWLNPPEWIAEVAAEVDAKDDFADVAKVSGPEAQRLIRQSAIDAAAAQHPKLKKRTLTNLYNERPTWLRLAHLSLDRAVLNAYAATDPAPHGQSGWTPAWAEVFEPTGAGQPLPDAHPLTQLRAETEQNILAALLNLNHQRAATPTPK
jgi:hypothetical protein